MSQKVWNGPLDKVTQAAGAAGAVSDAFSMPANALGVTFFIPALAANVTLRIMSLQPKDDDQVSDAWNPLSTTLTDNAGAIQQSTVGGLGQITNPKAVSFDAGVLGAGVFRFESEGIGTQGAAVVIRIAWRVNRGQYGGN